MSRLHLLLSPLLFATTLLAVDDKPSGAPDSAGGLQPVTRDAPAEIAPASDEAANVVKNMEPPKGMQLQLWAAEPALANPVALSIDERGRVFVAETQRLGSSVLDIRNYMFMLEDDLACKTIEDRLAMCRRHFGAQFEDLSKEEDYIRLLEDRDHDGKADFNSIYAGGFNKPEDGIAAGVLARHDHVWATIIPDLWSFEGTDTQGHAESRQSLSHGYGIRFGYTGHDMHGLILGPDGRLYFSIGDRAANVTAKDGRHIENTDSGAVFRCDPDGSNLELVHRGLRNPQELAFDDFGNLFTGDNDFDYGDTERLVYVVEGGDSGWRVGYQHPPLGKERVVWKAEQIWVSFGSSQERYNGVENPNPNTDLGVRPAAYLPPVTNVGDGPSGLLFDPGTGISPEFRHHFFLCHSKGSYARSEIHAFTLKQKGATFELGDSKPFIRYVHSPDLDIAPDGSVYVLDWSETMSKTAKGRVIRMFDPAVVNDPKTIETKNLLEEGMAGRPTADLSRLLGHADRRVRQEAQFELVKKNDLATLESSAQGKGALLPRLHAIWGLGQIGRHTPEAVASLLPLLDDPDSEVRAQAAKVLGDARFADAAQALISHLKDDNARVKFFSAMALGRLKAKISVPALVDLARSNDDQDAYIRHACVFALGEIHDAGFLSRDFSKETPPVQMVALLTMRRLKDPAIAQFLGKAFPIRLQVEAARAISDEPIPAVDAKLAALRPNDIASKDSPLFEPLMLRVIEALRRTGGAEELAQLALNQDLPDALRDDCVAIVGELAQPMQRDRVLGLTRAITPRDAKTLTAALAPLLDAWTSSSAAPDAQRADLLVTAIDSARRLKAESLAPKLTALIQDTLQPTPVRAEAMLAIGDWSDAPAIAAAVKAAQTSNDTALRRASLRLLPHSDPRDAAAILGRTFTDGSIEEKAEALATLGQMRSATTDAMLLDWLDRLANGKAGSKIQLDIIEAARVRTAGDAPGTEPIAAKLKSYLGSLPQERSVAAFPFLLDGGDAQAGRKVFFEHTAAQCIRCHKIGNKGSEVGPHLDGIGKRQPREYLLESILFPNNKIAQGFEMTMITTKDGKPHGGMVRQETGTEVQLSQPVPNSPVEIVKKADIASRTPGISAMPEMFQQVLTQREIRDLVAFLAGLKK